VFFIWSLTFRVLRVTLVFFPTHFLFGLARLLPFRVGQTQCSLRTLCCSTGSLLEFCRPFLFATSCSAFTWSACGTCSGNLCRSFLLFSSSFSLVVCFLRWVYRFALWTCADHSCSSLAVFRSGLPLSLLFLSSLFILYPIR